MDECHSTVQTTPCPQGHNFLVTRASFWRFKVAGILMYVGPECELQDRARSTERGDRVINVVASGLLDPGKGEEKEELCTSLQDRRNWKRLI